MHETGTKSSISPWNTTSDVGHYRFDQYYVKELYVTAIGVAPPAMSRLSSSAFRCRSSVICKEDLYSKELIQPVAVCVGYRLQCDRMEPLFISLPVRAFISLFANCS